MYAALVQKDELRYILMVLAWGNGSKRCDGRTVSKLSWSTVLACVQKWCILLILCFAILYIGLIHCFQVVAEGNEHGSFVAHGKEGTEGELQVRGPSVFKWLVEIKKHYP